MILDDIVQNKKSEVKRKKNLVKLSSFKPTLKKSNRDFKKAITTRKLNLIAEIKRKSPSEGILIDDLDLIRIVGIYDKAEVAAISFVTDEKFFGGNVVMLNRFRKLTKKPLLRKDFIVEPYQVYEPQFLDKL